MRADEFDECDPRGELERHDQAVIAAADVEDAALGIDRTGLRKGGDNIVHARPILRLRRDQPGAQRLLSLRVTLPERFKISPGDDIHTGRWNFPNREASKNIPSGVVGVRGAPARSGA
jgi:hypothetical protein